MSFLRVVLTCATLMPLSPQFAWGAVAGTVDSLSGAMSVARMNGSTAQLKAGDSVSEGDTLTAGHDGWALLEMSDGASITLRPNTRLRIDAYRNANGDPSAARAWLSLLTGALRAVTGAIGHNTPAAYRISTAIVTIGVRGTDHEPAYYPEDAPNRPSGVEPGVYDKVNEGEAVMHGSGGEIAMRPGQAGFLSHRAAGRPPRVLESVPGFYAQHAALDRRLADRMKSIRERHQHKWLQRPTATGGMHSRSAGKIQERKLEHGNQRHEKVQERREQRKAPRHHRKEERRE
jgi:hypothetical protein